MNIAERIKSYYETEDFESHYFMCLSESFHYNKGNIVDRILDLFNVANYETAKNLSNWFVISREQAIKIYDFINDNLDSFTKRFHSYYVGYTSLESVSFGEQEEQLAGLHNHKTGKDYSISYLKKAFDKEGYYVRNNYAYYDISSHGLHVDLLKNIDLLNNFLTTIK